MTTLVRSNGHQSASKGTPKTMSIRRTLHRKARRAVTTLGLAAILAGIGAAPAMAAPAFEVQLTRDMSAVSRSDERVDYTVNVKNVGPDPTAGTVSVETVLPGGLQTFVFSSAGTGWTCTNHAPSGVNPAKAVCSRSSVLAPGATYPSIIVAAGLGDDAPDLAIAKATASGGGAVDISVTNEFTFEPVRPFEIVAFDTEVIDEVGNDYTQAGGHPFSGDATFSFSLFRTLAPSEANFKFLPVEHPRIVVTDLPRGFVGNALAVPKLCPGLDEVLAGTCPPESVVGGISIDGALVIPNLSIYSIAPEFGRPAQFAFAQKLSNTTYTFAPRLRAEDGYAITLESAPIVEFPDLRGVDVTLCGFGAKTEPSAGELLFDGCREASEPEANDIALITNPTRCVGTPPSPKLSIDSWEHPGTFASRSSIDPMPTGCDQVRFEPTMDLEPSSNRADSPTGMDVEIGMPTDGLVAPNGVSQANLKRVTVTLPQGMAVNASAGHGLGACTAAQVGMDAVTGVPNDEEAECPDASKIGTIAITTPLIQEPLTGDVFIAKQGADNPFDSTLALYMVFSSKKDGVTIKVAGEVAPDPVTGQLVVTFDDNPEAPFSSVDLHFPQGPRSPLINPPMCGTYEIKAELTPWSAADPDNPTAAETVVQTSSFAVTEGPNGGPCPTGALEPKMNAGTQNPVAGTTSPFTMRLWREDGSQRFRSLSLTTPPGLTAYLKGIPYCPDAVLASISPTEGTGQAEIDAPACPAASKIGTAIAGAGAGPNPLFVDTGRAYLAGPYKGAPLSLVVVAPAVAGPLDLGNVVVRNALYVNSRSAQITAVSDPIPTILHGLLLDIRDIRIAIDRPNFTLNPTNCEPLAVGAEIKGENGGSASLANRFQVGGCENLKFKPKLEVRLFGGTHRGAHPRLRGVLEAAPGHANIGRASVTVPRSEFLDQAHIRTICTRVQFAADQCPKGSIYGHAVAYTPLLDYPVEGPVYLRSSDNKLPDLVVALRGPAYQPIEAEVVGRIDSINGQIRTTFENTPDVPLTKFVLSMQGGDKGLLINSRDICASTNRATINMTGQNGVVYKTRPAVKNGQCNKKARKAERKKRP